ncbi:MAG: hypothetical protein U1B80_08260 [Anaerolineaceae bacterium]|nr:hypothetical protein [Anaerolineaceae bacterium]
MSLFREKEGVEKRPSLVNLKSFLQEFLSISVFICQVLIRAIQTLEVFNTLKVGFSTHAIIYDAALGAAVFWMNLDTDIDLKKDTTPDAA